MRKLTFIISFFTVINLNAQTIEDYQQKLSECLSKRDYQCAEKNALASISMADPNSNKLYVLYTQLGISQQELGKTEEAITSYNKACELNCSPWVLSNRASLKEKMNDLEGCLKDYNQAVEYDPIDDNLLIKRSVIKLLLGDTIGYEEDLVLVLQLNPDNYGAFTNLVNIKLSKGEFKYVLDMYDKMISKYPNENFLFNERANVYLKMKNYDKALKDINTSIKIDNEYANTFLKRAEIFMALGNNKEALKDLQKAVDLGANSANASKLIDKVR